MASLCVHSVQKVSRFSEFGSLVHVRNLGLANAQLQPRRLMIARAAAGCKRMLGGAARSARLRSLARITANLPPIDVVLITLAL